MVLSGDNIYSGNFNPLKNIVTTGSSCILKYIPLFSVICCLELKPYSGSKIARSAGVGCILVANLGNKKYLVKLMSGWQVIVFEDCMATFGFVSNPNHYSNFLMKAGKARALGWRPVVRGVAKNPCDHPHGGGEGKKSPPAAQVSPWNKLTKGTPTKNKKIDRLKRFKYKELKKKNKWI